MPCRYERIRYMNFNRLKTNTNVYGIGCHAYCEKQASKKKIWLIWLAKRKTETKSIYALEMIRIFKMASSRHQKVCAKYLKSFSSLLISSAKHVHIHFEEGRRKNGKKKYININDICDVGRNTHDDNTTKYTILYDRTYYFYVFPIFPSLNYIFSWHFLLLIYSSALHIIQVEWEKYGREK